MVTPAHISPEFYFLRAPYEAYIWTTMSLLWRGTLPRSPFVQSWGFTEPNKIVNLKHWDEKGTEQGAAPLSIGIEVQVTMNRITNLKNVMMVWVDTQVTSRMVEPDLAEFVNGRSYGLRATAGITLVEKSCKAITQGSKVTKHWETKKSNVEQLWEVIAYDRIVKRAQRIHSTDTSLTTLYLPQDTDNVSEVCRHVCTNHRSILDRSMGRYSTLEDTKLLSIFLFTKKILSSEILKISPGGEIFNISRGKLIGKGSSWLRGGVLEVNRNVQPWSRSGQVIRISDQAGTVDYKEKLNRSRNLKDGKYRSILEIIGDANYLRYCYQQIKSKKGLVSCSRDFARNSKSNMTRGADKGTLDGIDMNWFEKAALDIREGKYKFRPVIIVGPGEIENISPRRDFQYLRAQDLRY